jgi:hypothetical protein
VGNLRINRNIRLSPDPLHHGAFGKDRRLRLNGFSEGHFSFSPVK